MAKRSAGILIYRKRAGVIEVLLVHPGGPFWKNKNAGAWSIPKGEVEVAEDCLQCAIREVREEIGVDLAGHDFLPLGEVTQKGGKVVEAWATTAEVAASACVSNRITIEWPPRSGHTIEIPEVDKAAWLDLSTAGAKINPAQAAFLERLQRQM
jgi:predicted NUDIX family NTP pyrophosphohydrolase